MNTIEPAQIDALLPFLGKFTDLGYSVGECEMVNQGFPNSNLDPSMTEFVKVLYDYAWVDPEFNWYQWQDTAEDYVHCPERIAVADLRTIQQLLTTHVRKERFCEGHLGEMITSGHIVALLQRLRVLRTELEPENG